MDSLPAHCPQPLGLGSVAGFLGWIHPFKAVSTWTQKRVAPVAEAAVALVRHELHEKFPSVVYGLGDAEQIPGHKTEKGLTDRVGSAAFPEEAV